MEIFTTTTTSIAVPVDRVCATLCTAFEGGIGYWAQVERCIEPSSMSDEVKKEWGEYLRYSYPVSPGGAVIISCDANEDGRTYRLDIESITKGIEVMRTKYPLHFADFIEESDDAGTGDCFVQCCLFGEMVYG